MMSFYSPPKFFKTIQYHELQNGSELRIPKKYVKKYWKNIPNPIFLRFPNGVEQKIFWVERNGAIFFKKNWEKFAKCLKYGNFLTFKYIGGEYFKVNIFGGNALEVNYSNIKSNVDEEVIEVSEDENEEDEFEDESEEDDFEDENDDDSMDSTQEIFSSTERGGVTNSNNPSFEVRLTPTSAQGYSYSMPTEFSKKYMKGFKGKAILRVVGDEDRSWKLRVKYNCVRKYATVTSGWQSFTKENNLQIGDVCKFEMIQTKPLTFTVTIIRVREEPRPNQFQDLEGPNAYTFKFVVNTSYPYVPKEVFSRRHGEECNGKFVELKVGGKSWFVKLYRASRAIRFYKGWSKFKEECIVEIGDTCFFELIDEEKLVFKVSFQRKKP